MRRSRRRCSECSELFSPHPRVASRQRACSKPECQRRRHAAAQADWVRRHAGCYRGRAVKHRSYREQVKSGAHVPERRTKPAEQSEQDEISAQDKRGQSLEPLSRLQREQDEILAQVVLLTVLVARWLRGGRAGEQDELGAMNRPWSSPAFGDDTLEPRDDAVAFEATDPTIVNAHAEARRDGDATFREHRFR